MASVRRICSAVSLGLSAWWKTALLALMFVAFFVANGGNLRAALGRRPEGRRGKSPSASGQALSHTGVGSACPAFRGEYDPEHVEDILRLYGFPEMWHSRIDEACPKFVYANQNYAAGIGHRLTQYTMALHTAIVFNITFVHTSLDGGHGQHGNYNGWDRWLAFTKGEHGLDDVAKRPGIKRVKLPGLGGYYLPNEEAVRRWKDVITNPNECNVLYEAPQDQWMYDVSTSTKAVMTHKYYRETRSNHPALLEDWDPRDVNIAVHVRIGDQYPTHERVVARVVRDTILPELDAAGVRAKRVVHVFAENKAAETFPELAGLPATVRFHASAPPMQSFWHLTIADFLVETFSSFSWAASQIALRPLSYSQPSSDIYKMCGEATVCCLHSGDCTFAARYRTKLAAERIAAQERCGTWGQDTLVGGTIIK